MSEGAESNNKDDSMVAKSVLTLTNKGLGKRGSEYVESLDDIVTAEGDTSTTKESRIVSVKVEEANLLSCKIQIVSVGYDCVLSFLV